jgi:hypothetical protein
LFIPVRLFWSRKLLNYSFTIESEFNSCSATVESKFNRCPSTEINFSS